MTDDIAVCPECGTDVTGWSFLVYADHVRNCQWYCDFCGGQQPHTVDCP